MSPTTYYIIIEIGEASPNLHNYHNFLYPLQLGTHVSAECKTCFRIIKDSLYSTTNFSLHLRANHTDIVIAYNNYKRKFIKL